MFLKSNNKSECCGCSSCMHSCPTHAIDMKLDDEGFPYPHIDASLCINCGLCEKVCPVNNPKYDNNRSPKVYATMVKDSSERVKSASGGVFYQIAKYVISHNGIVFGAVMDEDFVVKHIGVKTINDLSKLRGSKYVQSDLNDVFRQIREELQLERLVYFVGTGCQVAGLKSYLKKNYSNLLTSDIACHGVPSQALFDKHIQYLENRYNGNVVEYSFRDNEKWCYTEKISIKRNSGKIKMISHRGYSLNPYIYAFMNNYISRYSCYDCKFAKIPRQGDLTLADYWGVKRKFPQIDSSNGVSLVIINNEKGSYYLNLIADSLYLFETNIEDAVLENKNIVCSSTMPALRKTVFDIINIKGYGVVAKTLFRPKYYWKLIILNKLYNWGILSFVAKFKKV